MADINFEQLASQAAMPVTGASGFQRRVSAASAGTENPFDAIIMQMLMQMQEGAGEGANAMQALTGTDADEQQMLAQGAAGLFQFMPQNLAGLQPGFGQNTAENGISALGGGTQSATDGLVTPWQQMTTMMQAMMQSGAEVSSETVAQLAQLMGGTPATRQADTAVNAAQMPGDANAAEAVQAATAAAVTAVPAEREAQQPGQQEASFSDALDAQTKNSADAQKTRPEAAAEQAAQPRTTERPTELSETQMAKAEAMSREPQLLTQLEKGINETLSSGKQEFTMKLKPEALGEITVRLVEEGGHLTLRLTAESAQTAKLINSDLAALREAVRPMNVEVQEAVQQNQSAAGGNAQYDAYSGFLGGQQFANQQQAYQQQAAARTTRHFALDTAPEQEAPAEVQALGASGALDTYV